MLKAAGSEKDCLKPKLLRQSGVCKGECMSACVKEREMRARLQADRGPGIIQWWRATTDNYTYGHWGS